MSYNPIKNSYPKGGVQFVTNRIVQTEDGKFYDGEGSPISLGESADAVDTSSVRSTDSFSVGGDNYIGGTPLSGTFIEVIPNYGYEGTTGVDETGDFKEYSYSFPYYTSIYVPGDLTDDLLINEPIRVTPLVNGGEDADTNVITVLTQITSDPISGILAESGATVTTFEIGGDFSTYTNFTITRNAGNSSLAVGNTNTLSSDTSFTVGSGNVLNSSAMSSGSVGSANTSDHPNTLVVGTGGQTVVENSIVLSGGAQEVIGDSQAFEFILSGISATGSTAYAGLTLQNGLYPTMPPGYVWHFVAHGGAALISDDTGSQEALAESWVLTGACGNVLSKGVYTGLFFYTTDSQNYRNASVGAINLKIVSEGLTHDGNPGFGLEVGSIASSYKVKWVFHVKVTQTKIV
jgi:hypothetical protein